jgi:hypothetical protein
MKPPRRRKDALLIAAPCVLFGLILLIDHVAPDNGRDLATAIERELKD